VANARDTPFEHRFAPSVAELPIARKALREWLASRRRPVDPDACQELLVVATELSTAALKSTDQGLVTLRAWEEEGAAVVEVEAGDNEVVRAADEERGWMIVRTLCDDLSVLPQGATRIVRCRKRLRPRALGGSPPPRPRPSGG
jgi:hypothetical protein